jgi:hypothetical protein
MPQKSFEQEASEPAFRFLTVFAVFLEGSGVQGAAQNQALSKNKPAKRIKTDNFTAFYQTNKPCFPCFLRLFFASGDGK